MGRPCRYCLGFYEQHNESPTPLVDTPTGRHEEKCPNVGRQDHRLPEGLVRLVGKPARHAFYEDGRSPTGLTFYCAKEDWRFIVRVEDFFCYCPACGQDHRAETMSANGLWMVARGEAP